MNHGEPLSDESMAELLACPGNGNREADPLREALNSYRTETLQWAERRSATQPSLQAAARRSRMWAAVPQWSLAAVAAVSIAAGVTHVYDRGQLSESSASVVPAVATVPVERGMSAAEIAADNRLLSSIDQELSYHAASPVDELGLEPAHATRTAGTGVVD